MNQFTLIWRIRWMLYSINKAASEPWRRRSEAAPVDNVNLCVVANKHDLPASASDLHQVTALLIT
jgi:hypothetical protein